MRKTVSFAVSAAIVFLLFCAPFSAIAEGGPVFYLQSHNASVSETVDMDLSIKNSPGICSAKLYVYYDGDLILESVTYNGELGGITQEPASLSSPVILNWMSVTAVSGDKLFATLRFTVAEGASSGEKYVEINFDPDDVCDIDENSVDFSAEPGIVCVTMPCAHDNTELRNAKTPSLTEPGYTGDVYCVDCGEKLADGETVFCMGDANTDGLVNIKDYVRLAGYIRDNTIEISDYADVDDSKIVDSDDCACLRKIILGLDINAS
ncbi:MAG: hypothetical protein J5659_05095 [Clostridia bacterium]|nr:hypothetical protein [Clostridia bacterium]